MLAVEIGGACHHQLSGHYMVVGVVGLSYAVHVGLPGSGQVGLFLFVLLEHRYLQIKEGYHLYFLHHLEVAHLFTLSFTSPRIATGSKELMCSEPVALFNCCPYCIALVTLSLNCG